MAIVGIGRNGLAKRRDGLAMLIELLLDVAKHEPGRRKAGSQLHRLRQQIDRAFKVAAQLQVAREIVTPVRHQIAGRHEQTR